MADEKKQPDVESISEFMDYGTFGKIVNKLTDFAEILSEGKLSGIVNFNFRLNSIQTNNVIDLLRQTHAVSKIYTLALKGARDLEVEYISNIFSDPAAPNNLTSYISLRTLLENRLNHQIQQYNMNMGKHNNSMAMPINELRGHVKTYLDLTDNKVQVSSKAQHGMIAASLHDAYITLLNRGEWWMDRTYIKFFFNEDDPGRRKNLVLTKEPRVSLEDVIKNVQDILSRLTEIRNRKTAASAEALARSIPEMKQDAGAGKGLSADQRAIQDKMLMTPFGRQYGELIDGIINGMFSVPESPEYVHEEILVEKVQALFQAYRNSPRIESLAPHAAEVAGIAQSLISRGVPIKTFPEKFLGAGRRETHGKFYAGENKVIVDGFLSAFFEVYFEQSFNRLFRIVKSLDLKRFACAYIMKRIYLLTGERLTDFGYYLVRTVARIGGIKTGSS